MSVIGLNHEKVLEKFRNVKDQLEKLAVEMDRENRMPEDLIKLLKDEKLFGLTIPEEFGGLGYSLTEATMFSRFIGSLSPALALSMMVNSQVAEMLYDKSDVFSDYLNKMASGDIIGGLGITEPGAGSDVNKIKTVFKFEGDRVIVNGVKSFLTNGRYADIYALLGRTEDNEFVLGIVPKNDGVEITQVLDLVGMRGSGVSVVKFENVEIEKDNIVLVGKGALKKTLEIINRGRLFTSASAIGVVDTLLGEILKWIQEREVFGRKLVENDYIQQMIGEYAARAEASWVATIMTAKMMEQGVDARHFISISKLMSARLAMDVSVFAMQMLASHGYIRGSLIERLYRDAKALEIMEGTNEVQRMTIFRTILKRYQKSGSTITLVF